MNTIAISLYALTAFALVQPTLPEVQEGLPREPADYKWVVGQVVLFLTLVANLIYQVYDSRQKREAEKEKAKQLAEADAAKAALIEREAERLSRQRAEDRAEAERQRRWDREEAERIRKWDLEDRALAREKLAMQVETTRTNLEQRVDKQQAVLVQKLDENTELTINAAQKSEQAAEIANNVNAKFVQLAQAIDSVRGTAASLDETHAAQLIPEIKEISEDTNARVRGLEEER